MAWLIRRWHYLLESHLFAHLRSIGNIGVHRREGSVKTSSLKHQKWLTHTPFLRDVRCKSSKNLRWKNPWIFFLHLTPSLKHVWHLHTKNRFLHIKTEALSFTPKFLSVHTYDWKAAVLQMIKSGAVSWDFFGKKPFFFSGDCCSDWCVLNGGLPLFLDDCRRPDIWMPGQPHMQDIWRQKVQRSWRSSCPRRQFQTLQKLELSRRYFCIIFTWNIIVKDEKYS